MKYVLMVQHYILFEILMQAVVYKLRKKHVILVVVSHEVLSYGAARYFKILMQNVVHKL